MRYMFVVLMLLGLGIGSMIQKAFAWGEGWGKTASIGYSGSSSSSFSVGTYTASTATTTPSQQKYAEAYPTEIEGTITTSIASYSHKLSFPATEESINTLVNHIASNTKLYHLKSASWSYVTIPLSTAITTQNQINKSKYGDSYPDIIIPENTKYRSPSDIGLEGYPENSDTILTVVTDDSIVICRHPDAPDAIELLYVKALAMFRNSQNDFVTCYIRYPLELEDITSFMTDINATQIELNVEDTLRVQNLVTIRDAYKTRDPVHSLITCDTFLDAVKSTMEDVDSKKITFVPSAFGITGLPENSDIDKSLSAITINSWNPAKVMYGGYTVHNDSELQLSGVCLMGLFEQSTSTNNVRNIVFRIDTDTSFFHETWHSSVYTTSKSRGSRPWLFDSTSLHRSIDTDSTGHYFVTTEEGW